MAPPRKKPLVHTLPVLNIQTLHRARVLTPGNIVTLSWSRLGTSCEVLVLHDWLTVTWPDGQREEIDLIWRDGTLGGRYPSLRCPQCGRSAATLYDHAGAFACRVCKPVAYPCQSEDKHTRTLRRVGQLRERLGWERGVISPEGARPRYMNQSTYARLSEQIDVLTEQALATTAKRLRRKVRSMQGS